MNQLADIKPEHTLFDDAVSRMKPSIWAVVFFSLCINLLMLTSPIYMLQVYDRVLISRSTDTLILLSVVAFGALIVFGVLETVRSRVLVRVSAQFDQTLVSDVFKATLDSGRGAKPFRDLESIRTFLTGRSFVALLDAPWTPIYLALIYFLHPWLGHVALIGAIVLVVVVLVNERITKTPLSSSAKKGEQANRFVDTSSRNRDSVKAMGMIGGLETAWNGTQRAALAFQAQANDRRGLTTGIAKFARIAIQVGILGVGAYLAINEVTSPGVMIAASIISGRALAPVEAAITGWRSFVKARDGASDLRQSLQSGSLFDEPMPLPPPEGEVTFKSVFLVPANGAKPILSALNFRLEPGTSMGLTGPSGAGKSSLARMIAGIWAPTAGEVRLDGAEFDQWSQSALGPHIGYLSQDIELFPGTVAENIARFSSPDPCEIVAAAKLAGAHETIVGLSEGYDTQIGGGEVNLSGGQRQRIGLARAFYKRPSLVVLDEPTSNLDAVGEAAVREALEVFKKEGKTVVVVAHRPSIVAGVDKIMVLQQGVIQHFGDTNDVMPKVTRLPTPSVQSERAQ